MNKKFFAKSTKMYAVLRRNLRDLRIIASQVQRLQARNPQTTQTLVRTYMQGKGSRAEINNIWIQVQSFTYVFTYYVCFGQYCVCSICNTRNLNCRV